jgi:UDP-N-acetylmuramate--alanine ligase
LSEKRLLDKQIVRRIHFVGIGGIGLSAIARVLQQEGYRISGSDARQTPLTAELAEQGMVVHEGHRAENVTGADLVVVSSAVPENNPELVAAREAGIPVVKRADILGEMMADKVGIAVAGTHGKTTTSALVAFVLTELGLDPTFIIGGIMQNLGTNARRGQGPHFVIEADEYDHTFLGLRPKLAVVTVIEMDHPDCFADIAEITQAFGQFVGLLPDGGTAIGCADQPRVLQLLQQAVAERPIDVITYGLRQGAWQAQGIQRNEWGGSDFTAFHGGQVVGPCRLRLPGLHNVSNALAVLAVAHRLGLNLDAVLAVLPHFEGVRRRFELKGEARGVVVIDDYAHHPTEIQATLSAARRRYSGRPLWVFFQPHTYSRTRALLNEFATSFDIADHVLIAEIYAARETDNLGLSAQDLVQLIRHRDVRYVGTLQEASDYLGAALRSGDVLLTLGAGDGYVVGETVLRTLTDNEQVRAKHGGVG